MKIATWNVNGIRAREAQMLDWVQREQPDVICLQEIKARPDQVPESLCQLGGYWCYWHGAGGYSGVGLHFRKDRFPEEPAFSHPDFDHETRIVQAVVGDLVIASVYVPNGGKDYQAKITFLTALEHYVTSIHEKDRNLVLCGDMNVARTDRDVHPKERKANIIGQRPEERALIENMCGRGVVDVGRALHPDDDELFTWWPPWRNMKARNIGWRLDYVMASIPLAERAESCAVQREFGTSDHGPVIAAFRDG